MIESTLSYLELCFRMYFSFTNIRYALENLIGYIVGYSPFEKLLLNATYADLLLLSTEALSKVPGTIDCGHLSQMETFLQTHLDSEDIMDVLYNDNLNLSNAKDILLKSLKVRPKFEGLLRHSISQMRKKENGTKIIISTIQTGFLGDQDDQKILYEIWSNLMSKNPPANFTHSSSVPKPDQESSWGEIGFQNPLSDFRGSGKLGLMNLHYFSKVYQERAKEILHNSYTPENWFPFAITGINITMWLFKFLQNKRISIFFFSNPMDPLEIFNSLYCYLFLEFSRYWILCHPKNILEFKKISEDFLTKMETKFAEIPSSLPRNEMSILSVTGEDLIEEICWWVSGEVQAESRNYLLFLKEFLAN